VRSGGGAVLLAALLLTGCGSEDTATPDAARSLAPAEDFADNMHRCMSEKGWETEISWDGGLGLSGVPADQVDQVDADVRECRERFGYDRPARIPSQQEAEELYDALMDVAECVRERGFPVPDPPSRQAYVEDFLTDGYVTWHPYDTVRQNAANELPQIAEACPAPTL
jgi:hypothetical protein